MTHKPPRWADLLLTGWVVVVAVIFFGPIFVPAIGLWTAPASVVFVVMLMIAAVTLALRVVRHRDVPPEPQKAMKNRKRR